MKKLIFQKKLFELGIIRLKTASKKAKDDKEFVFQAIKKYGAKEFKYASDRLRSEFSFIFYCAKHNPEILQYVLEPIHQRSRSAIEPIKDEVANYFSVYCFDYNPDSIKYMTENMVTELLRYLIASKSYIRFEGSEKSHSESEFGVAKRKILEERPEVLENLIELEKDNPSFMTKVIYAFGLEYFTKASERLQTEGRFILNLVSSFPEVVKYIEKPVRQRYIDEDGKKVDIEMPYFGVQCLFLSSSSYKYMPEFMTKEIIELVNSCEQSKVLKFTSYGEENEFKPSFLSFMKNRILEAKPYLKNEEEKIEDDSQLDEEEIQAE